MEMTYDGTLVMPSSYAVMDEDEMMYFEGGAYRFDLPRNTVAHLSDIAIAFATVGVGIAVSIKRLIIMRGTKVAKATLRTAITKVGLSAGIAYNAANLIMTVANFTIGGGIAYLLDLVDSSGLNGRVQF